MERSDGTFGWNVRLERSVGTFFGRTHVAVVVARRGLSENVEMYLETIYVLTEKGALARTKDIAAEWKVSQPSATEMVQKLAAQGYLNYEPYKGASLTPEGMRIGTGVIRKHRLLEKFLVEIVRQPPERAEDDACHMEHVIPPEMEAWVCELLGHPRASIKGEPIPRGACCPP